MNKKAVIPQERIDELIAQMNNSDDFCFEGDFQDCAKILVQQEERIAALQAEVDALKWQPITPENMPKLGDEIYAHSTFRDKEWDCVSAISADKTAWTHDDFLMNSWTHFRPITPPIVSRATPPQDVENGGKQ